MKNLLLTLSLLSAVSAVTAQSEYEQKMEKDGIQVTYQWRPSDKKTADSPLELDIVLKNTTGLFKEASFSVAFYDTGEIVEESAPIRLCFKPGQTLKGRKFGLCLISEHVSNNQIRSEGFDWSLEELKIKEATGCN